MAEYLFEKNTGRDLPNIDKVDILQNSLNNLGLGLENLSLNLQDDKIYVSGLVADQASLEKIVLFLGNIKNIAMVNSDNVKLVHNIAAPKLTRFYEVKPKDSLWKIAEEIYGITNGDKYKIIFEANKPIIEEPDDLFIGQILRIPNIDLA